MSVPYHSSRLQQGFTLVELAIVLMIIGLLIGGVLRGQELMNNARLQNIIKQVTSYQGAVNTFRDAYSSFPGDLRNATARLPGCDATSSCVAGDGNGIIGVQVDPWNSGNQSISSENAQFWKHLALAHLITGIDPSYNDASISIFGKSHPSAVFGGFSLVTSGGTECPPGGAQSGQCVAGNIVLRLHGNPNAAQIEVEPAVSPHQAAYIDRKMDDGRPDTGDVVSGGFGAGVGCEGTYDETREDAACVLLFMSLK